MLTFSPILGTNLITFLLFILLAGTLFLFPLRREKLTPRKRNLLLLLRGILFFLVGVLLFRPTLQIQTTTPLPSALILAVDTSESMSITDMKGNQSRYDALKEALQRASDTIETFQDQGEIHAYRFDQDTAPVPIQNGTISLPEIPDGERTAIGESLQTILARSAGERILGLILLTDGTQKVDPPLATAPRALTAQDAAFRYRDAGIHIYPILFGETKENNTRRDMILRELIVPERVFAKNQMTVTGTLQAIGCAGSEIPLQLHLEAPDGTVRNAGSLTLSVSSNDETIPFRFVCALNDPGEWKVTVSTEEIPNELLTGNNQKSDFVEAVDGGFNLLFLEGTPRFEQKFIRLALESSAEIHTDYERFSVDSGIQIPGETLASRIAAQAKNRPSLSNTLLQPGRYAGYILGDIDASAFTQEELGALAQRVKEGAGLILLAGERAFAPGGYADTELAPLFPVTLNPQERIPLDLSPRVFYDQLAGNDRILLKNPVSMFPTEEGARHYLTQLHIDPDRNQEIWEKLPPLTEIWKIGTPTPGAEVLAAGSDGTPILITQPFGEGRVALLATDSTWRWSLGGFDEEQKRFWRQLTLWTANRDQLQLGELILRLDRRRFTPREPVDFQISYRPLPNEKTPAQLEAILTAPNGESRPLSLMQTTDTETLLTYRGSIAGADQEGDYKIEARALYGGKEAKSTSARFLIEPFHPELDNPVASPTLLATLASITSGESQTPDELSALMESLSKKRENLTQTHQTEKTLYDRWEVLALFILLLSVEWFLRKRWGLV